MNRADRRRAERAARKRPRHGPAERPDAVPDAIKAVAAGMQGDGTAAGRIKLLAGTAISQRAATVLLFMTAGLAIDLAATEGNSVDELIEQRWTAANRLAGIKGTTPWR